MTDGGWSGCWNFVSHSGWADADPETLRTTYASDRTVGLDDSQWKAAGTLAAYSALGLLAPPVDLPGLSHEQMIRLGACQTVIGTTAGWRLPSPTARNVILHRIDSNYPLALHKSLSDPLRRLLDSPDMAPVLQLLEAAKDHWGEGDLHIGLIRDFATPLVVRLSQHASSQELAWALPLLDAGLSDSQLAVLVRQLADRLSNRGWPTTSVEHVISCLRAMRNLDHLLGNDTDAEETWELLLRGLDQVLASLVAQASPQQVLGLMKEFDRLRRPGLTAAAMERLSTDGLRNVHPSRGDDLFTAIELASLARRIDSRAPRRSNKRTLVEELVGSPGWQRMARAQPLHGDAADYLAHLAVLGQQLDGAVNVPEPREIEDQLRIRIPRTHLSTLAQALERLRNHAPLQLAALRRLELASMLVASLEVAPPLAVSQLLTTLKRLHPRLAIKLIYERDGRPQTQLLDSLVNRVQRSGDLRAASYLITACANVDREFGVAEQGFGQMLVLRLRSLLTTVANERRPLVALSVVRALASASCEMAELDELRVALTEIVRTGMNGRSANGYEAEIALILSSDEVLNGSFLSDLRGQIESGAILDSSLLAKMKAGDTPGALVHYHALALAVDPAMAIAYRDKQPSIGWLVRQLRDRRLQTVLQAIQAIGRTLSYAGQPGAARDYLLAFEGDPADWAARLRKVRGVDDLRMCIDVLMGLAPDIASSALESFGGKRTHDGVEVASERLVDIALSGATPPADGIALLALVCEVHPVLAARAVENVIGKPRLWRPRLRSLVELDDPTQQGQALKRLARLDLPIDTSMLRVLDRRWWEIGPYMRNPWTIGTLIGGLLAVDADIGWRLAGRLDHQGLIARVARKRRGDGPGLASLITSLGHANQAGLATRLAESLIQGSPSSLSASDGARLLLAIHGLAPEVAYLVGERLRRDVLEPALASRVVLDPDTHLLGIGWLARRLQLVGCRTPNINWNPDNTLEHPAARLWSEAWLAPSAIRKTALERLSSGVAGFCTRSHPWELAVVLIVAASQGKAADMLSLECDWPVALQAGPVWLAELVRAADSDPVLRTYLAGHEKLSDDRAADGR